MKPTLNIMVGLPGSGKDTYISKKLKHTYIVSDDAIREMLYGKYLFIQEDECLVHNIITQNLTMLLWAKKSITINCPNLTIRERRVFIEYAKQWFTEYDVIVHYMATPPEVCMRRREANRKGYHGGHWTTIIKEMCDIFEPPKEVEGAEVIITI